MEAIEPRTEIPRQQQGHNSDGQWPNLVARALNDLSRIVHAEFRLAELGIKQLVEQEIDRVLKVAIALSFLLCAAICAIAAAIIGLHALLGLWWPAFAIVAGISGLAGTAFFRWAERRPALVSTNSSGC